ncbi:MAG: hypothetical protein LBT84_01875 [Spirochaetia bacterium]|nr:hypothetical protein [Spirochaetia bacterium]
MLVRNNPAQQQTIISSAAAKEANYYKNLTEEAANSESSNFGWHKKLGLVNSRNKLLDELMEK